METKKVRLPIATAVVVGLFIGSSTWFYAFIQYDSISISSTGIEKQFLQYLPLTVLIICCSFLYVSSENIWAKGIYLLWSTFPGFIIPILLPISWIMQEIRSLPNYSHDFVPKMMLIGVFIKIVVLIATTHIARFLVVQSTNFLSEKSANTN